MSPPILAEKTQSLTERWTGESCLLNGKQAVIRGRLLPFAVVHEIDGDDAAEYAWTTVDRIMNKNGRFFT